MNRNQQTRLKMDNKNVPNNTVKSVTKPAKKLKKLMETPTSSEGDPMECKPDKLKKRILAAANKENSQP